jgi:hypothetical protein
MLKKLYKFIHNEFFHTAKIDKDHTLLSKLIIIVYSKSMPLMADVDCRHSDQDDWLLLFKHFGQGLMHMARKK